VFARTPKPSRQLPPFGRSWSGRACRAGKREPQGGRHLPGAGGVYLGRDIEAARGRRGRSASASVPSSPTPLTSWTRGGGRTTRQGAFLRADPAQSPAQVAPPGCTRSSSTATASRSTRSAGRSRCSPGMATTGQHTFPSLPTNCERCRHASSTPSSWAPSTSGGLHRTVSKRQEEGLALWAFDLLYARGRDIRDKPYVEREWRLAKLVARAKIGALRHSEFFGDGELPSPRSTPPHANAAPPRPALLTGVTAHMVWSSINDGLQPDPPLAHRLLPIKRNLASVRARRWPLRSKTRPRVRALERQFLGGLSATQAVTPP
jgi:hypothetical protein